MSTELLYLRADDVRVGDVLSDVSRSPVAEIRHDVAKGTPYVFVMANGYLRRANYGGPEYGYECFQVERSTAEAPKLDPLPYTPPGYQWEGCRSAWPVLRGSVLDVFAPRPGYSQNVEDYA